jgi:hypothetical protein
MARLDSCVASVDCPSRTMRGARGPFAATDMDARHAVDSTGGCWIRLCVRKIREQGPQVGRDVLPNR